MRSTIIGRLRRQHARPHGEASTAASDRRSHHYTDDSRLAMYVFEESYVLGYELDASGLTFRLEVTPSNTHPKWHPPVPPNVVTSWYGRLVFTGFREIRFVPSGIPPASDVNGELDHGSIDSFVLSDDRFVLSGHWGDLKVTGGAARVVLDDPSLEP